MGGRPRCHYGRSDIVDALLTVGLRPGDTIFSHSNIGFFGLPQGVPTQENAFKTIYEAFLEVLGPTGTLCVPTFTYSFSQGKVFDLDCSPSDCGVFTETLRRLPEASRSEDPSVSVAAVGAKATLLTRDVPVDAYGDDGFFARFLAADGAICNMNFDAGSTFVHYAERVLAVPYRFLKTFRGTVIKRDVPRRAESTLFVRYLVDGTEARFEAFDRLARGRGAFRTARAGRGFVGLITARDTLELIREALPEEPWLLTKAGATGLAPDLASAPR